MVANLYICESTFTHNGIDTVDEIKHKISQFSYLYAKLCEYPNENVVYINSTNLYETVMLDDGTKVGDIINDFHGSPLGKEATYLFLKLFKSKKCDASKQDMLDYLSIEDRECSHGILVMNIHKDLPSSHQIISTVQGWLKYRRLLLQKYHPADSNIFSLEIIKYFPVLEFHATIPNFLGEVYPNHVANIIYCLSILNDHFIQEFRNSGKDLVGFLPEFSSSHKIKASLEGKKLQELNLEFNGEVHYCEAHLKCYKDDNNNTNQHLRVYFSKPTQEKIYIGRICKHIK